MVSVMTIMRHLAELLKYRSVFSMVSSCSVCLVQELRSRSLPSPVRALSARFSSVVLPAVASHTTATRGAAVEGLTSVGEVCGLFILTVVFLWYTKGGRNKFSKHKREIMAEVKM